jgi:hypothetical protein
MRRPPQIRDLSPITSPDTLAPSASSEGKSQSQKQMWRNEDQIARTGSLNWHCEKSNGISMLA